MTTTTMDPITTYPTYTPRKTFKADVEVTGNFEIDDSTPMTIDPLGAAHIIALIINLYSDPEAATVREYISNALDSHTKAGAAVPVEVFSASNMNPTFVVRDHGVGMSPNELRTIYAVIGASTKRDDMAQLGAYGLGCKSALSLSTQFTVKAVKDGTKTIAVVMRKADGTGDLDITKIVATDEPNGVTITIPVPNSYTFNKKILDYAYYAKPGTLLIDGKDTYNNIYKDTTFTHIPELRTYYSTNSRHGFMVTTGGASYKVDIKQLKSTIVERVFSGWQARLGFLSDIPIGSIDLTPSRDDIQYTPRTIEFLRQLSEKTVAFLQKNLLDEINKAATRLEFATTYQANSSALQQLGVDTSRKDLQWKNQKVEFTFTADLSVESSKQWSDNFYTSVSQHHNFNILNDLGHESRYYMVVDAPEDTDKAHKSLQNRVRTRWLTFNKVKNHHTPLSRGASGRLYVFYGEAPKSAWFTELYTQIAWDDFKPSLAEWRSISAKNAAANRNNTPAAPAEKITYPVYTFTALGMTEELVPFDAIKKDWLVAEYNRNDSSIEGRIGNRNFRSFVPASYELLGLLDKKVVYVRYGRKLEALHKKIGFTLAPITEHVTKTLAASVNALTPEQQAGLYQKLYNRYNVSHYNDFYGMVLRKKAVIKDPLLLKKADEWNALVKWDGLLDDRTFQYAIRETLLPKTQKISQVEYVKNTYPLVRIENYSDGKHETHIVLYINHVYDLNNS